MCAAVQSVVLLYIYTCASRLSASEQPVVAPFMDIVFRIAGLKMFHIAGLDMAGESTILQSACAVALMYACRLYACEKSAVRPCRMIPLHDTYGYLALAGTSMAGKTITLRSACVAAVLSVCRLYAPVD